MKDIRGKMETEIGRLMIDNHIKIKETQIRKMVNREIFTMMKNGNTSESATQHLLGFPKQSVKTYESASRASRTQMADEIPIIEKALGKVIDFSTIGEARIDLNELDRILYRGDSPKTLQPDDDSLLNSGTKFKEAASYRGQNEEAAW